MRPHPLAAAGLVLAASLLRPPAALAAGPIEEHVCSNGLTVLVVEDHSLPLVTIEIAAKNGSMTESEQWSGLSHLYGSPVCC